MSPVGWRLFRGLLALVLAVLHGALGSPDSLSELGTLIPVNPFRSTSGKDSCLVLALGVDITYIFIVRYSHSEVYPLLFSVIMVGCFFYDHRFGNFFALTILSLTCYPLMYLLIQFYPHIFSLSPYS